MSYSKIFKDKSWTIQAELDALAKSQNPLESMDLLEILHLQLVESIASLEDKSLQAEFLSILPELSKMLETCQKIFLLAHLQNQNL